MREKHPIDERFKAALYEAEATPPDHVRAALAQRMGWDKAPKASGGIGTLPLLLVGVTGAALALFTWGPSSDNNVELTERTSTVETTLTPSTSGTTTVAPFGDGAATPATESVTGTSTTSASTAMSVVTNSTDATNRTSSPVNTGTLSTGSGHQRTAQGDGTRSAIQRSEGPRTTTAAGTDDNTRSATNNMARTSGTEQGDGITPVVAGALALSPNTPTNAAPAGTGAVAGNNAEPLPTPAHEDPAAPASALAGGDGPEPVIAGSNYAREAFGLALLDPVWAQGGQLELQPRPAMGYEPYVLSSGYWWWGPYAGYGTVRGSWTGPDAEELDRAEHWRSSGQVGLMGGRGWRSGFSVGAGVGMASVRSDLNHELRGPDTEVTVVDTAWVSNVYPGTDENVYTWSVVSSNSTIPGTTTPLSARNRYTVVQVPVSLWWHGQMRRWSFGAMAGVMGWIPTEREGTTLLRSGSDGLNTATDLADTQVDRRFGTQIHGLAGLSLGYTLTERLTLLAEPMLSAPIYSADDRPEPSLTRPTFQIRLQHELRSRH